MAGVSRHSATPHGWRLLVQAGKNANLSPLRQDSYRHPKPCAFVLAWSQPTSIRSKDMTLHDGIPA